MNCLKIINLHKQYGLNRLYLQSFLTGLLSFVFLYVPISIRHGMPDLDEFGIFPLLIAILFMPFIHVFMHMLPLIMMNKQARLIYKQNTIFFSNINYYTKNMFPKSLTAGCGCTDTSYHHTRCNGGILFQWLLCLLPDFHIDSYRDDLY